MERRLQFPLPYKEPNSALILRYYPLLNKILAKGLRHMDEIGTQLTEWKPTPTALSKWVDTPEIYQNNVTEAGRAIHALGILGSKVAIFLSKVYGAVEAFVDLPPKNERQARELLKLINGIFLDFEASVRDSPVASLASVNVSSFATIPFCTNHIWTRLISAVIDHNGKLLDTYLSTMVIKHTKPRGKKWFYYTIGGIGVSLFLIWLLRQEYDGTSYHEALINFLIKHVNKPLISIREDLFKRSREAEAEAELKDIKEASDMFHSMLVEFTGQKSSKDIDMFRDVRRSTKEHFDHPVRSVLNGGLIRGIIIRAQRLILDYEIGRHWISTFVSDNKLNIAMLSALPAILLFYGVSRGCRAMVSGARELDRNTTRSLIADVEKAIIEYLKYGSVEDWGALAAEALNIRFGIRNYLLGDS